MRMLFDYIRDTRMPFLLVPVILSILQACGKVPPSGYSPSGVEVDEEFVPEVLAFQKECDVEIKALSLRWGPTRTAKEPDRVGYCIPTVLPLIRITKTVQGMPAQAFRLLVYHELGHCILGLDHTEKPNEIMSAYFDARMDSYFRANWDTLVNNFCGDKQ